MLKYSMQCAQNAEPADSVAQTADPCLMSRLKVMVVYSDPRRDTVKASGPEGAGRSETGMGGGWGSSVQLLNNLVTRNFPVVVLFPCVVFFVLLFFSPRKTSEGPQSERVSARERERERERWVPLAL